MRLAVASVLLLAVLVAAGCGGGGLVPASSGDLTQGKALFVERCGSCHTLADAGTQGKIGPNLDDAFAADRAQGFEEETILQVVHEQIAYPGIGLGMPANLVTGADADSVAAYVARYAGNTGIPPSAPVAGQSAAATTGGATGASTAAGGAIDGKATFTQNCASCHTLAAAGSSGNVGPNLDDLKPDKQTVVTQVTNGGAAMPAFKDQLSQAQIDAVAQFVSDNAGK